MTSLPDPSNVTAQGVMDELIVRRGLSYQDAIRECERLADAASEPYRAVADRLREELGRQWTERTR